MPSSALRLRDLRAIYEIAHECRDRGDDPAGWRRHFVARLAGLTGAGLALGGEMLGCPAGDPRDGGVADWGWENGFDRGVWLAAMATMEEDATRYQLLLRCAARLRGEAAVTATRPDLLPDREWDSSFDRALVRSLGADHTLWSFSSLPRPVRGEVSGVILYRPLGEKNFGPRVVRLAQEAHALIAPLIGRLLARFGEPSPSELPPRIREVLRCLLEGDSDKQVAARLGISKYTVNQYVKAVFGHFGVTTRAELLARWVRRGWGNGFAW